MPGVKHLSSTTLTKAGASSLLVSPLLSRLRKHWGGNSVGGQYPTGIAPHGFKPKPPGVARQQVTFLVLPRKVTKRGRPRFAAPSGFPRYFANKRGCATRPGGAHKTCPTAELKQCSPTPPLVGEILRRRTGEGNSRAVLCGHSPRCFFGQMGALRPLAGWGWF